ncbi:hypothetical protein [Pelagibacterium limicola]|uniref:hypothetical protein n=1 Tax=Pelagibacterium limicola TaxID=2791022 RepID=UPI0018AFD945|nr:hypothetical protein [Pelagibacterium limicola]
MNTKFLLPLAAISALALAACGGDTPPPAQPDPDAGPEVVIDETQETTEPQAETTQDLTRTVEEIQQEAAETFEQILQQTEQTGEEMRDLGTDAMQSMNNQLQGAEQSLEAQVDELIAGLANLRDENLTDEQKLQAVASARTAAENAARLAGRSEQQIAALGRSTEDRAREALGL